MLLYQSFPRRSLSSQPTTTLQRAIFQIGFLAGYGLLMTPECLSIPANPLAKKHAGSANTNFTQCRACFTLIERDELWTPSEIGAGRAAGKSHAELFGAFAIGIDPVDARVFGVAPVTYYYAGSDDANRTHEMLFRLREMHELFTVLAVLEAKIEGPDAIDLDTLRARNLVPKYAVDAVARITDADRELLQAAFDLIDTDRPAAWRLADNLEMLLDTLQTADSATSVGSLAYYEQREWRITREYGAHLDVNSLGLARLGDSKVNSMSETDRQTMRDVLTQSDPDYFTSQRLDDCTVLAGSRGRPFFDFVKEIVTPSGIAADSVGNRLNEVFPGMFSTSICNKGKNTVFSRAAF